MAALRSSRLGLLPLLLFWGWCGLWAGLLEVATTVLRKQVFDHDHFYRLSRHFVWLVPLSNVVVFLALGLLGCALTLIYPGRVRWLVARLLGALVLLPSLLVASARIYTLAWFVMALGIAARLVPLVEQRSQAWRRFVLVSSPVAIALVAILGGSIWLSDRLKEWREHGRPLPPPGSPNVLLIVMDTVGADHLSLQGYDRPTSNTLVELAGRAIRFNAARATASWTLPSHASMFTGRWFHDLPLGWFTPLGRRPTTLAEFLGSRGYATAGFIANTGYCAWDSGLARGFTRYDDFILPKLTALNTAALVGRLLDGFGVILSYAEDDLGRLGILPYAEQLIRTLAADRKGAAVVNRELLDWLSHRAQGERPFFAFLNYNDAHYPYELPPGRLHRFGAEPTDRYQRHLIQEWGTLDKKTVSPVGLAFALDAYDDCIADLDEQLGKLVDRLDQRGILEHTWLIITADHGECFGEHGGLFCHGASLFDTELHVPLLIIPPGGRDGGKTVKQAVSLRDLAATVVDLVGQREESPFPGTSLARFWRPPTDAAPNGLETNSPLLAEVIPYDWTKPNDWGFPQERLPMGAIKGEEWSYIRHESTGREELFHLSDDPRELHNVAGDPALSATLERMRALLHRMTQGPLSPDRFLP
ncbi:MAG: sulfatase [Isosphaeraceae bacterium]